MIEIIITFAARLNYVEEDGEFDISKLSVPMRQNETTQISRIKSKSEEADKRHAKGNNNNNKGVVRVRRLKVSEEPKKSRSYKNTKAVSNKQRTSSPEKRSKPEDSLLR